MEAETTYRLKEVAKITGIGYRTILNHIRAGRLTATQYGNATSPFLVKQSDLDKFIKGE